jgi:hypothetical protein
MNASDIPTELPITMDAVCALSLECWRLRHLSEQMQDGHAGPGLRYAVRHIAEALEKLGIEVLDLSGRPYDPGMAPEVVEVKEDASLQAGQAMIDETVSPTVTWHKHVVRPGQIIIRRSVGNPQSPEAAE